MLHLTSTPNRPQSNGVIERFIRLVIDGARRLLHQSGLPLRYWTFAARAFRHGRNVSLAAFHGDTPWKAKHGEEFKGALIPFGAKVVFCPFRPAGHKGPKFAPRSEFGLFAILAAWWALERRVSRDLVRVAHQPLAGSKSSASVKARLCRDL